MSASISKVVYKIKERSRKKKQRKVSFAAKEHLVETKLISEDESDITPDTSDSVQYFQIPDINMQQLSMLSHKAGKQNSPHEKHPLFHELVTENGVLEETLIDDIISDVASLASGPDLDDLSERCVDTDTEVDTDVYTDTDDDSEGGGESSDEDILYEAFLRDSMTSRTEQLSFAEIQKGAESSSVSPPREDDEEFDNSCDSATFSGESKYTLKNMPHNIELIATQPIKYLAGSDEEIEFVEEESKIDSEKLEMIKEEPIPMLEMPEVVKEEQDVDVVELNVAAEDNNPESESRPSSSLSLLSDCLLSSVLLRTPVVDSVDSKPGDPMPEVYEFESRHHEKESELIVKESKSDLELADQEDAQEASEHSLSVSGISDSNSQDLTSLERVSPIPSFKIPLNSLTLKSVDLIGKMIYDRDNAVQEELNYLEISSISDIQEQEIGERDKDTPQVEIDPMEDVLTPNSILIDSIIWNDLSEYKNRQLVAKTGEEVCLDQINSDQLVGESSGSTEIPDESSSVADQISEEITDGVETPDSIRDTIVNLSENVDNKESHLPTHKRGLSDVSLPDSLDLIFQRFDMMIKNPPSDKTNVYQLSPGFGLVDIPTPVFELSEASKASPLLVDNLWAEGEISPDVIEILSGSSSSNKSDSGHVSWGSTPVPIRGFNLCSRHSTPASPDSCDPISPRHAAGPCPMCKVDANLRNPVFRICSTSIQTDLTFVADEVRTSIDSEEDWFDTSPCACSPPSSLVIPRSDATGKSVSHEISQTEDCVEFSSTSLMSPEKIKVFIENCSPVSSQFGECTDSTLGSTPSEEISSSSWEIIGLCDSLEDKIEELINEDISDIELVEEEQFVNSTEEEPENCEQKQSEAVVDTDEYYNICESENGLASESEGEMSLSERTDSAIDNIIRRLEEQMRGEMVDEYGRLNSGSESGIESCLSEASYPGHEMEQFSATISEIIVVRYDSRQGQPTSAQIEENEIEEDMVEEMGENVEVSDHLTVEQDNDINVNEPYVCHSESSSSLFVLKLPEIEETSRESRSSEVNPDEDSTPISRFTEDSNSTPMSRFSQDSILEPSAPSLEEIENEPPLPMNPRVLYLSGDQPESFDERYSHTGWQISEHEWCSSGSELQISRSIPDSSDLLKEEIRSIEERSPQRQREYLSGNSYEGSTDDESWLTWDQTDYTTQNEQYEEELREVTERLVSEVLTNVTGRASVASSFNDIYEDCLPVEYFSYEAAARGLTGLNRALENGPSILENSLTEGHETSLGVNSPAALSEKRKPLKCDPWATELLSDSEFAYLRRILENWGNYEVSFE
ncbi:uncharacterized protein LOC134826511 [Bolinopsis microptera]|uniref:uncharacterized protein LOC134826511 n=1 Tax=Bolinopsis microptera TaxID=2820187 RepID=UPI0030792741